MPVVVQSVCCACKYCCASTHHPPFSLMICILDPMAILTRAAVFKRSAHPYRFCQPKQTRMTSSHYAQGSGLFFFPSILTSLLSFPSPHKTVNLEMSELPLNWMIIAYHSRVKERMHFPSFVLYTAAIYHRQWLKKKSFNVASRLLHQQQLEKVGFLSVYCRKLRIFFSFPFNGNDLQMQC